MLPQHHVSLTQGACVGAGTTPSPCSLPPFLLLPLSAPPKLSSPRHLVLLLFSRFPSESQSLSGLNNPPMSSLPDQVPFLLCSHPSCPNLGFSLDGATSTLIPPGLPPPFPLQLLLFLPLAHTSYPSSPPYTRFFTAACSARPPQPGFAPCSHLPPSPSPGLGLFLWCREPRREALASSSTSCPRAGTCFPEEALFRVCWRLLPGDNNLLIPL